MRRIVLTGLACASALLCGACVPSGGGAPGGAASRHEFIIASFERGEDPCEALADNVKVVYGKGLSTRGKCSAQVSLPPGPYPGLAIPVTREPGRRDRSPEAVEAAGGDWSKWDALAFDTINPGESDISLSIRIDDLLSRSYSSRLNYANWAKLKPGVTSWVLPLKGLELGSIGSRGLDLKNIRTLIFFVLNVKKPMAFHIDNVRLLRGAALPAAASIIPAAVKANEGVEVTASEGGSVACKITGGRYPGFSFRPKQSDWLGYDCLRIATDADAARSMTIKVDDGSGRSEQCITGIPKGKNTTRLPLHILGHMDLTRIRRVAIFFRPEPGGTVSFGEVSLEPSRGDIPAGASPMTPAAPDGTRLELDCLGLAEVGRNTGMAFFAYPRHGRTLVATPRGKGDLRQVLPLAGMTAPGGRLPVAAYFLDHGMRHFASFELEVKPGDRSVWKPTIKDLAH